MSIRWKLFLALFLLTAGATVLVLVLAERGFRESTRERIAERFDAQITGLRKSRMERLDPLREFCTTFVRLDELKSALREGSAGGRKDAIIDAYLQRNGRNGGPLPLMGLISLDGEVRSLAKPAPTPSRSLSPRERAARLARLTDRPAQQVGYLVVDEPRADGTSQPEPQEVVLTPVTGADGALLGWFFLGSPAVTREERTFQRAETVSGREGRTGIVVDGQWFMPGMTERETADLDASVSDRFWQSREPEVVRFNGEKTLIMAAALNPDSPLGLGYQVTLFPIGSLVDAIRHLRLQVALLGLVAVAVAGAVALVWSHRFTRPIAALVAGTERVRRGDFEGKVEVAGNDELGRLAGAFNTMTRDLALKERYREVLGKVSDPAVAQRLIEGELELGGEVLKAAVLFCDIRGFTSMTDGMPPAKVIDLVNEHMTALTRLVYQHGGVVDKFVGDLVMAVFGAPQSKADDALRAARCARAMIDVRRELNAQGGRPVEIGIGVAFGELVAGCMGSTDRLNYTVLGDRVNLASRLCDTAGPGEVLVDAELATAASAEFALEERPPVSLKGFAEPAGVWALGRSLKP